MRGSVRRRGKGWEWRARTPEGREISKGGYRLQGEAEDALTKELARMGEGRYVEPDKITVKGYLEDVWLPAAKPTLRPTSYASVAVHVKCHLAPGIGKVPLQKLTEAHLVALYGRLAESGNQRGKRDEKGQLAEVKGLSATSIRHVHATLRRALGDAVEWRYVVRNVAEGKRAKPPQAKAPGMTVWTAEELQKLLAAVEGERLYPFWRFLAMTGTRRGEAAALEWSDLDLQAGVASIARSRTVHGTSAPKTERSRRSIDLDPRTVAVLKAWRKQQLEERVKWGELWTDTRLVFTREDGKGYHPDGLTGIFERVQRRYNEAEKKKAEEKKKAGAREEDAQPDLLPRIRVHDLRHTHASLLLASGVNPKIVSERLGHASVAFTLTVYAHVLPGLQREAIGRLAALVDG